ncbi:DUF2585 domain-containing protein [Phyllobacterium sp. 21LDTY02-6]|jgi:hypothetical protein|uniref:DUF2585 domain-containing protein n=1 Tax=Phyllobacterium sp. 21LDTY02-6 TaxID=2944903 RepID=UPI00202164A3|nr:DUF2585 domain-containing protein [Phyllobacterium sp. 21LDTY02-6]MCO4318704.1 DUF2585 domain-containing protein [Phyllobacterium sp. 21LDTY02-6]
MPATETIAASRLSLRHYLVLALLMIAIAAAILLFMGRNPICTCGTVKFWVGETNSADNSQHIADWYTLSHIIHGFIFYGILWVAARRRPLGERLLGAIFVEAAWEIFENTDMVIDRYREATIALGYVGDSVLNSVSDILFMVLGFFFAARAPVWLTVVLAIFFELLAGWVIRDNLTLNVVMLLYPLEAIKAWQGSM